MKKLYEAVDRFCARHPRFGIPNLMLYISIGTILVYVLLQFSDYTAISFLTFDLAHVLHGEVWRIITYIFVPMYGSPFPPVDPHLQEVGIY